MNNSDMDQKISKMSLFLDFLERCCQKYEVSDLIKEHINQIRSLFIMMPTIVILKFCEWKTKNLDLVMQKNPEAFSGNSFIEQVASVWPSLDSQAQIQIWDHLIGM